jgi:hypothetical protein
MNIGNALLNQDMALFTHQETEEALILMRYFLEKEKSPARQKNYLDFIHQLEKRLRRYRPGEPQKELPAD